MQIFPVNPIHNVYTYDTDLIFYIQIQKQLAM